MSVPVSQPVPEPVPEPTPGSATPDTSRELRYDALSGRTVIVATGRAARPHQFRAPDGTAAPTDQCPFCAGHEAMTPPEVMRIGPGAPDTPGWRVRAVPNLYPIVPTHEVVALSPDHSATFGMLTDDAAVEVFTMLRDRAALHVASGHACAVAILNHKREAGASLPHPHAQVLATEFVPPAIAEAVTRAYEASTDLVLDDARHDASLSLATDPVLVWCPHASSAPCQMRVADPHAGARFDRASDEQIARVALALRDALGRLRSALDDPPYNFVVHSAPHDHLIGTESFHWYVEVTPRLNVVAGFEIATGVYVNSVAPEHAAGILRAGNR